MNTTIKNTATKRKVNQLFLQLSASEAVYNQLCELFQRSGLKYQIARPIIRGAAWNAEVQIETGLFDRVGLGFLAEVAKLPVLSNIWSADNSKIGLSVAYHPDNAAAILAAQK
jgi:hypothetical protein